MRRFHSEISCVKSLKKKHYNVILILHFKCRLYLWLAHFDSHVSLRNGTEAVTVIPNYHLGGREGILFANFRAQNKRVVRKGGSARPARFRWYFQEYHALQMTFEPRKFKTDNYYYSLWFRHKQRRTATKCIVRRDENVNIVTRWIR